MSQYRLISHTSSSHPASSYVTFLIKKMYSLDKISKLKDARFSFRYTYPKTQKIKTIRSKQTGDLIQRRKEIQKLQAAAPFSSIVSLKPFGMILDRYIDDRKNDAANGHLRQATLNAVSYTHLTLPAKRIV